MSDLSQRNAIIFLCESDLSEQQINAAVSHHRHGVIVKPRTHALRKRTTLYFNFSSTLLFRIKNGS